MAVGSITISVQTALLQRQLGQLADLLEHMPQRRARRFGRKAYRLLVPGNLFQDGSGKAGTAVGALNFAYQIRVGGMDELIAAAHRAAKCDGCI